MTLPMSRAQKRIFWSEHLRAAKEFSGSEAEYCRRQGLKISTFNSHKSKSSKLKSTLPVENFIPIVSKEQPSRSREVDPEWLALFLKKLFSK